jgi:hypothetical protein
VKGFQSQWVEEPRSGENARLRELWKELEMSRFWGRFVSAAKAEDVEALAGLRDFVVMLDSEPPAGDVIPPEDIVDRQVDGEEYMEIEDFPDHLWGLFKV